MPGSDLPILALVAPEPAPPQSEGTPSDHLLYESPPPWASGKARVDCPRLPRGEQIPASPLLGPSAQAKALPLSLLPGQAMASRPFRARKLTHDLGPHSLWSGCGLYFPDAPWVSLSLLGAQQAALLLFYLGTPVQHHCDTDSLQCAQVKT